MQPCNRIYYSNVYWRLNMFREAHRSSSGAPNCICSLCFIYTCGDRPLSSLSGKFPTQTWQRPVTTCVYKPDAVNTVWSSRWWAVCRSKHVEPSVNVGIINSITRLHLVGSFYWFILRCTDPWILTLILLTWRIWWSPNNASRWQMGFNSAFKGLKNKHTKINCQWEHVLENTVNCLSKNPLSQSLKMVYGRKPKKM